MRNAFFVMVFSGVLGLAALGCGSSDSSDEGGRAAIIKVCDKMKTCEILDAEGLDACKAAGNEKMSSATSEQLAAIDKCLAKACDEFFVCVAAFQ